MSATGRPVQVALKRYCTGAAAASCISAAETRSAAAAVRAAALADDLIFPVEPERRSGQVDEFALVFQQQPARPAALRRGHRCRQILEARPIDFGNAVETLRRAARRADRFVIGCR